MLFDSNSSSLFKIVQKNIYLYDAVSLVNYKNTRLLRIIQSRGEKYLQIPANLFVGVSNGNIFVKGINKTFFSENAFFFKESEHLSILRNRWYSKKLTLVGLGYKVFFVSSENVLIFRLGYSHIIRLRVPAGITIKIRKNIVKVACVNRVLLGNFCMKIKSLRKPSMYKNKGIFFKYDKTRLKEIKKK